MGSRCNLNCTYCFYRGTDELLGGHRPPVMSPTVLDRMLEDYLGLGFPTGVFVWQGGEPTLAGIEFFRRVVEGQMAYGQAGQLVGNALQTNGMLIDDTWAEFLAEYRFLVGLSLDGPEEVHNHYRTGKSCSSTFDRVTDAAVCLRRCGVEFNILCMITNHSEKLGREIYRFFAREGFYHLQFIPCVEYDPLTGSPLQYNVSPEGYGRFMSDVFDEWYENDIGKVAVRTFEALVGCLVGEEQPGVCTMGKTCNNYLVVEKEGDVYPCDFFVSGKYYLGNLMENSLFDLYVSDSERSFAFLKSDYPEECRNCPYLDICYGGCPKDRLCAGGGKYGKATALCEGLKFFFEHAYDRLMLLADSIH